MDTTPKAVLRQLDKRDGHVCSWSGYDTGRLVPQHRQRGMGGRADLHRASNLVWLDSIVNGSIEWDPLMQERARALGIKIDREADPEETPIDHAVHGLVLLRDDWSVRRVTATGSDAVERWMKG